MNINRRRKRAIEKAEKKLDKHENWKEHVQAVGGSLRKDKDGRYYGLLHVD